MRRYFEARRQMGNLNWVTRALALLIAVLGICQSRVKSAKRKMRENEAVWWESTGDKSPTRVDAAGDDRDMGMTDLGEW